MFCSATISRILMILLLSVSCGGCVKLPKSNTDGDSIDLASKPPELIESLVRPYWYDEPTYWRAFFRSAFLNGPFNVKKRDGLIALADQTLQTIPVHETARLLVLEQIGRNGLYGTYDRAMVAWIPNARPETTVRLKNLGITSLAADQWRLLEPNVEQLLRIGGNNNGRRVLFDTEDALVLSYFDGRKWRVETWFCLSSSIPGNYPPPYNTEGVPKHVLLYGKLLLSLNAEIEPPIPFQSESPLIDMVKE